MSNVKSVLVVSGCYLAITASVLSVCRAAQIASMNEDVSVVMGGALVAAVSLVLAFKGLGDAINKDERHENITLKSFISPCSTVLMGAGGALLAICAKGFDPLLFLGIA